MSLKPCKFFDIRSGKPVLIGDANDALQWAVDNVPDMVDELLGGKEKPKAEKKLGDAFAKWKAATGKQGIAFDPKSQAEADIEFLKAIAEYIKDKVSEGAYAFKQFVSDMKDNGVEGVDEFKDDWKKFFDDNVPPPPVKKEEPTTTGGESKERKTITSLKEAIDVPDEVKEALGGERTRYEVLPNEVSVKEANAILKALGETEAKALVLNGSAKIPGPFRTTLAQVLMKAYNAKGEYNNAVAIAEGIAEMATDWGQAVQALSLFQYLTPEGQILAAQRGVDVQVKKKLEQHKPQMDKLKKKLKEADKEAIDETLDKVTGRIETVKPAVPKRALSYGEKNKIFTDNAYKKAKAGLKNFAFSGIPPELVTIAGYHVEAGARSFADFSKEMIKDFGRKVKPYLKGAYKAAQEKLKGEGYSTDKEIADYLASDVEKDVASILKESGVKIQDLIRKHYTESEKVKQSLTDKLVERLGLDQADAETISKAVETEFNKIAKEKKEKAIASVYNRLKRKTPQVKSLQQKLIELSNLGAFDEDQFKEAYAEAFGFPKLTTENAAEIKRLAEIAQGAKEGLPKFRATEDLLKYQATIKGADWYEVPMAIWMSSILSGPSTQIKNLTANFANMALSLGNVASQNPKNIQLIMKGLAVGMKKGVLEGQDVFKTGYSPIRDKAQIPDILERTTFKGGKYNPYNYYKYIRRAMVAADVVSFEGLKEMRAYQMALMQAKENFPDANAQDKAMEILNNTSDAIALAQQKATDEFNEIKANIEANSNLSEAEKTKQIEQAEQDSKRRFYEFIEELRPDQLVSEAHDFAERGTFNNKPDGFLGMIAQTVNQLAYRAPLIRLVVPFTNVITNVANETINYSPLGFVRAARGGSITGNRKEFSDQQKKDLQYKAAMATTLAVVLYALASIPAGDDDEPLIEITADGFNDFKKNKDLQQTGWAPYSIRIGNRWFSYKLFPLVGMLATIGALKDYEKYRDGQVDDDALTKWSFAFQSALSTITNQTFLPSLDTFLSALLDKKGDDRIKDMEQWAAKTAATGVPVIGTNFYQQLAMQANEMLDIPEKEYRNSIFGKMLRTVPIARNMYENAVNGLGEEIPLPQTNILISKPRNDETQKLWDLIAKNKASTGTPDRKGAAWIDKDGVQKEMTDRQFYEFAKARGEYIRKVMENDFATLSKMSQPDFKDWMNKTRSNANNYAQAVLGSGVEKKTTTQQAKATLNPNEPDQKRAKELFQSAIEMKNTKLATESIGKFINAYPTKIQKRKAIESLLEGELNEEVLQGKVGIDSKLVDEFFKFYNGASVNMGNKNSERYYNLTKLKELAENKVLADDLVRKYEAEYEKAKATRELLMSLDMKDPESGRPIKVPYPSWMKYYERKIMPSNPISKKEVKKEKDGWFKTAIKIILD